MTTNCVPGCRSVIDADCPRCDHYGYLEHTIASRDKEIIKLEEENRKLYALIKRMQRYFAPATGEWQFVEAMLEGIKEIREK